MTPAGHKSTQRGKLHSLLFFKTRFTLKSGVRYQSWTARHIFTYYTCFTITCITRLKHCSLFNTCSNYSTQGHVEMSAMRGNGDVSWKREGLLVNQSFFTGNITLMNSYSDQMSFTSSGLELIYIHESFNSHFGGQAHSQDFQKRGYMSFWCVDIHAQVCKISMFP